MTSSSGQSGNATPPTTYSASNQSKSQADTSQCKNTQTYCASTSTASPNSTHERSRNGLRTNSRGTDRYSSRIGCTSHGRLGHVALVVVLGERQGVATYGSRLLLGDDPGVAPERSDHGSP